MAVVKLCGRCNKLTALWQVGFDFKPRGGDPRTAMIMSGLCVCGLCADNVAIDNDEFRDDLVQMAIALTGGYPDAVTASLHLHDISDGFWRDPARPGELVPV